MVLLAFKLDITAQTLYMPGINGKPKCHCYYKQKTSEKKSAIFKESAEAIYSKQ